jgi:hypothetical protein
VSLKPVAQYKGVASGEARPVVGALDIGAYESVDPAANQDTATWTQCANEGQTCSFSGTREVRYGANGQFTSKIVTGSTPCTNAVFGDAAPNVAKSCSYSSNTTTAPVVAAPSNSGTVTWTLCAGEGSTCSFSGTREVRYGTPTKYFTKVFTGSVSCSTASFGGDPIYGELKSCSFASVTGSTTTGTATNTAAPTTAPTTAPTPTWTTCAGEGSTCNFVGTRDVRYGITGKFVTKTFTNKTACTNAVFGDPAVNVVKGCSVSSTVR